MELKNKVTLVLSLLFILVLSIPIIAIKITYSGLTEQEKAIYNATILEQNRTEGFNNIMEFNIVNNCYYDNYNSLCKALNGKAYHHYQGNPDQYKIVIFNARKQLEDKGALAEFTILHEIRHTQQYRLTMEEQGRLINSIITEQEKLNNYPSTYQAFEIDANRYANQYLAFKKLDKIRTAYG